MRRSSVATLLVVWLLASAGVTGGVGAQVAPQVGDAPEIVERTTYARTPENPGSVEVTLGYELPSTVSEVEVTVHPEPWTRASVVDSTGFERTGDWTFTWRDGRQTDSPSIRIRLPVEGPVAVGDGPTAAGTERPAWALVPRVGLATDLRWRYIGESPRFQRSTDVAGEGVVTDSLVYMGAHRLVRAGTGNGSVQGVVADGARPAASPDEVADFLARQQVRFDVGARRPATAIVLPNGSVAASAPLGQTSGRAFWVRDTSFTIESVGNTPAHEFVHTRTGGVGNGSVLWLREATAQYYGMTLSLNDGIGSFESFHRRLTARREETGGVVLARPETFAANSGEYVVGARVLAALDAQIRRRTDGQRTLADVFRNATDAESGFVTFGSAAAFRRAVVRVSGDPQLGEWVDRYTTTTERPSVPDDPALFVTDPALDPDGDGIESGVEVDRETNPFAADSDHDGLDDDRERALGTNASAADTDGDGLTDGEEVDRDLDPTAADTDGDGVDDGDDSFPADASRAASATDAPDEDESDTSGAVVWSLIGLWLLGGLAGVAAAAVGAARLVRRISGHGARLADVSLLRLVLVAVGAGVLSVAVLVVSSL